MHANNFQDQCQDMCAVSTCSGGPFAHFRGENHSGRILGISAKSRFRSSLRGQSDLNKQVLTTYEGSNRLSSPTTTFLQSLKKIELRIVTLRISSKWQFSSNMPFECSGSLELRFECCTNKITRAQQHNRILPS